MRIPAALFGLAILAMVSSATAADPVITLRSPHSIAETVNRLTGAIKAANFILFADIDHGAGATAAGIDLRPTRLIIVGNPKGGTPLMVCNQAMGLELPLKALVWEAADGAVNVTYTPPAVLAERHSLGGCAAQAVDNAGKALANITANATKP
jgi:uncharacterized protein (DUF302 family)